MTKIAIQPNASGTGTFTIAAPNSNNSRTLTLPDAAGEVLTDAENNPAKLFRRDNIIGTVSQSGGAPTGAVIEQGSNANGEYVRYADGTQIAWKRVNFSGITLNPANGSSNSALGANTTMAVSFVGDPNFSFGDIRLQDSGNNDVYGGVYTYNGTPHIFHSGLRPTNVWPRWDATGSFVVTQGYYDLKAIGRWF